MAWICQSRPSGMYHVVWVVHPLLGMGTQFVAASPFIKQEVMVRLLCFRQALGVNDFNLFLEPLGSGLRRHGAFEGDVADRL